MKGSQDGLCFGETGATFRRTEAACHKAGDWQYFYAYGVAWLAFESIDLPDFKRSEEKCQTTWRKLFLNQTFGSLGSG
jgi:hypothetical protein